MFWEIFDKNWIQKNHLDLIDNTTRNIFVRKSIKLIINIRKQRWIYLWIHRLIHKIIHLTHYLLKAIELGWMVLDGTKYDDFNIFPKYLHMIPETPLSSTELQIVAISEELQIVAISEELQIVAISEELQIVAISELLHIFRTCTLLISVRMQPNENCWWGRETLFFVISPWMCIRNNLVYTIHDRFGFIHVQGPMTKVMELFSSQWQFKPNILDHKWWF